MNFDLLVVGLLKTSFGVVTAIVLVALAARLLGRLLRWGDIDAQVMHGNVAAGILYASSLIALGLLVQHAVSATFTAMDLMYRGEPSQLGMLATFALYAFGHVSIALLVGALALALGCWAFDRMTAGIEEVAEVRKGNIAAAVVMGGVLILIAMLAAPGLTTMLDGLLPIPQLGRDVLHLPS